MMNPLRLVLLATALLLCSAFHSRHAGAAVPRYLVLRTPPKYHDGHATFGQYPGRVYGVGRHRYSYGWFGVHPRSHGHLHRGFYGNYTQWKFY